jgi:hypothetical protein
LLYTERGWDAPKTGEAFMTLWRVRLEGDAVRSWRRLGKNDYRQIAPREWRGLREAAMLQMRPPQPPRPWSGFTVSTGPPLLGDAVDRDIPEREALIILFVHLDFLRNVVVSRDDLLKAPGEGQEPPPERREFPNSLPGRLATMMMAAHPEGRWASVDKMWEGMQDDPGFRRLKPFSKRSVEEALALLAKLDSVKWTRKSAKKSAKPQRSAPRK